MTAVHMVSEHSHYEGNGWRKGEEVALEHSKVHDSEEKCKIQAYARVIILGMEGKRNKLRIEDKKIFHNTDQNPK